MDIKRLEEIATFCGFEDLSVRLQQIERKASYTETPLVLPLVGEFSAGKTSLINALTDSKKLETSVLPTTATIYEVHFNSDRCYASVKAKDGNIVDVEDIASLKNKELSEAEYVEIYDTSTKIPRGTLLIDTPGLSSTDPRHKQALVSFLPEADGILMVMDVNAQLTRSSIDFINTISLSGRPIYLVITMCDCKTPSDIDKTVTAIKENKQLPFQKIVCTSAKKGDLGEFYSLIEEIQIDKGDILQRVNAKRTQSVIDEMTERINMLLDATQDDDGIQAEISKQKLELRKIQKSIDAIFEELSCEMETIQRHSVSQFENNVFIQLDNLAASRSANFDAEGISIINNNSSLILNNFKTEVRHQLTEVVHRSGVVQLGRLEEMDLTAITLNGISYNLNLNEAGHQYDKSIAFGIKAAAALALVAAAAPKVAAATETVMTAGASQSMQSGVITADIIDTVSDVGSIISNKRSVDRIKNVVDQSQNEFDYLDQTQYGIAKRFGANQGLVESLVGYITDTTLGKPQRRKAIHEYLDGTLVPKFKSELQQMTANLLSSIKQIMNAEVEAATAEKTQSLERLLAEQKQSVEAFEMKMTKLREYRNELLIN